MILVNFRHEFAIQNSLVVALRQITDAAEKRARKFGKRMKSEVVDGGKDQICRIGAKKRPYQPYGILPKLLDIGLNITLAPSLFDQRGHVGQRQESVYRVHVL